MKTYPENWRNGGRMQQDRIILMLSKAVAEARNGVEYDTKAGARCPFCDHKTKVQETCPWIDEIRKRYHRCDNPDCALAIMGQTIKSWQYHNGKKKGSK